MTLCGIFLLVLLVLFTALNLAGFWICREDEDEAFIGEKIFLAIINVGTLVVSWAAVIAKIMGWGIA